MARRTRVKICCIKSVEEAQLAVHCGADALGLVSEMPSGPGVIDEATIADITAAVPPAIGTFLLTSRQDADGIIEQQRRCRTNTLQLCDAVPEDDLIEIRNTLPGISIVQVIHVVSESSVEEAVAVAPLVNGILLDSGNPNLAVKELGGTGRVHNWDVSRRICEAVSVPVFLAGGLKAGNVREAIIKVRPFGLDLCSSVRSDDQLDPDKLSGFFAAMVAK